MKTLRVTAIVGSLVALGACASTHEQESGKLSVADVPERVRHTVDGRFPGASVDRVEREHEHGTTVYDFELRQDGRKYEADVAENGVLLEVEKEIALANVPEGVARAAQSKYPGATVREVMEVDVVRGTEERPDHYEVVVVVAGKKHEVNVSLDGKDVGEEDEDEG